MFGENHTPQLHHDETRLSAVILSIPPNPKFSQNNKMMIFFNRNRHAPRLRQFSAIWYSIAIESIAENPKTMKEAHINYKTLKFSYPVAFLSH